MIIFLYKFNIRDIFNKAENTSNSNKQMVPFAINIVKLFRKMIALLKCHDFYVYSVKGQIRITITSSKFLKYKTYTTLEH